MRRFLDFTRELLATWWGRFWALLGAGSLLATYIASFVPGFVVPRWVPAVISLVAWLLAPFDLYRRQRRQIEGLSNAVAQAEVKPAQARESGPRIFLCYDLPEEAKKFPGLGITQEQLIVENTGEVEAYDVQVEDVALEPDWCRATFDIIPRLAAKDKQAPAMMLRGNNVPSSHQNNFEMILYASGGTVDTQTLSFKVPIVVTLRDYAGQRYRVAFSFRSDNYFERPEIRLEKRERITGS